jgi:hypothetical protein
MRSGMKVKGNRILELTKESYRRGESSENQESRRVQNSREERLRNTTAIEPYESSRLGVVSSLPS